MDNLLPVLTLIVSLIAGVVVLASTIMIYRKIGYAGWEAIIPIYNTICILKAAGFSGWTLFLFLVPVVNIGFSYYAVYKLFKCFDLSIGMMLLIVFVPLIGYPIWAFSSKYQYQGVC